MRHFSILNHIDTGGLLRELDVGGLKERRERFGFIVFSGFGWTIDGVVTVFKNRHLFAPRLRNKLKAAWIGNGRKRTPDLIKEAE